MAASLRSDERHLIALDLDGTVLGHEMPGADDDPSEGHISEDLLEAIRTLHNAGHLVVVATGRSVDATLPIVERLGIAAEWVIAANGAVTLKRDPLATRAYRREIVEAFDPTDALLRIRPHLFNARYAVELADGGFLYTEQIPAGTLPSEQKQVAFEDLLHVNASRVVVVSPNANVEKFFETVESLGLTHVSYVVGTTSWLDIAPAGVTKASALEVVRERMDVSQGNVFAAGDGRNDIEMLRWAGRLGEGVAMGQACEEVRNAATRTTASVFDDGLLLALRERFPVLLG